MENGIVGSPKPILTVRDAGDPGYSLVMRLRVIRQWILSQGLE